MAAAEAPSTATTDGPVAAATVTHEWELASARGDIVSAHAAVALGLLSAAGASAHNLDTRSAGRSPGRLDVWLAGWLVGSFGDASKMVPRRV